MIRKTLVGLLAGLGVATICSGSVFAMSADLGAAEKAAQPALAQPASFFGLPYPYGYAWRRHPECMRWVQVQTFWGVRWRHVWVCN